MTACAHLRVRQGLDVGAGLGAGDEVQVGLGGGAEHLDDELELVDVVLAWEQRLAVQQLCQDAPHRPEPAITAVSWPWFSPLGFLTRLHTDNLPLHAGSQEENFHPAAV